MSSKSRITARDVVKSAAARPKTKAKTTVLKTNTKIKIKTKAINWNQK